MNSGSKVIACAVLMIVCGSLCASTVWAVYSRTLGPNDFGTGIYNNVDVYSEVGGLALCTTTNTAPYLWVPSPSEGTVSKIDARTGRELGKYRMGPRGGNWQPCAVAVDSSGSAFVACQCPNSTGKIVRILSWEIPDKNGDHRIETSMDRNGDGRVTPTELLAWGQDEAVSVLCNIGGRGVSPSSLVFDENGKLWVCLTNECSLAKIDPRNGAELAKVMVDGHPTSALIGEKGCLLVLSREEGTLCEVNPVSDSLSGEYKFGRCEPSGMCFDGKGILWIATADGLIELHIADGQWYNRSTRDHAALSGIAYDRDGGLWAASPEINSVIKFSADAGAELSRTFVGKNPSSVSIDQDGYVWVLNEGSASAMRIDAQTGKTIADVPTPPTPFCSTVFTAFDMIQGLCPMGNWKNIYDSSIPGAAWGSLSWEAAGFGDLRMEIRSADEPELLPAKPFVPVVNGERFSVPNGRYLEVRATFKGDGYRSPILKSMHIEGTNRAPDISAVKPTRSNIDVRDGKFEWIGITGVKDPEGDKVMVVITGITQDEPVSGMSKEDKSADATGVGTNGAWLRRYCDKGTTEKPGNGRVYVVTYKAIDEFGASATGRVKVTVPPTDHYRDVAVDDGQKYDATKNPRLELMAKS